MVKPNHAMCESTDAFFWSAATPPALGEDSPAVNSESLTGRLRKEPDVWLAGAAAASRVKLALLGMAKHCVSPLDHILHLQLRPVARIALGPSPLFRQHRPPLSPVHHRLPS